MNEQIAIPDFSLVVLIGASGSGKSTFAAKHFLPTKVISSDRCRALICDDETNQEVTGEAFDLARTLVEARLKLRRLAVVDATNVRAADRKGWIEAARNWHALPVAIVIEPGAEVCAERNRARPDRPFGTGVVQRVTMEIRKGLGGLQREGFRQVWSSPPPRRSRRPWSPASRYGRTSGTIPVPSTSSATCTGAPTSFRRC